MFLISFCFVSSHLVVLWTISLILPAGMLACLILHHLTFYPFEALVEGVPGHRLSCSASALELQAFPEDVSSINSRQEELKHFSVVFARIKTQDTTANSPSTQLSQEHKLCTAYSVLNVCVS